MALSGFSVTPSLDNIVDSVVAVAFLPRHSVKIFRGSDAYVAISRVGVAPTIDFHIPWW